MAEGDAPDFAMTRAVEILARIAEGKRPAYAPPPPVDKPLLLFSEIVAFETGVTTRAAVEKALGIAFAYPTRGWHTYAVGGSARAFLSAFYKDGTLVACELYAPRSPDAPPLAARSVVFRLVPGEIALGMQPGVLGEGFVRVPTRAGAFEATFEARYPGGVAYAMTQNGVLERFALYAER